MPNHLKARKGQGSANFAAPGNQGKKTPSIFDKPIFSFQDISNQNDFSFKKLSNPEKLALTERLILLSSHPWSIIHSEDRHGIGSEKVKIPNHRIPVGVPNDRQYYALRFAPGNKAFVGYKCSTGIFHINWIDRKYTLYPH